jgi:hypothetical protein
MDVLCLTPSSVPLSVVEQSPRSVVLTRASLYLLTTCSMLTAGKAKMALVSASTAVLSAVGEFSKTMDDITKDFAKQCVMVRR